MRFKHNPWLSMVAALLLAAILALTCTGCRKEPASPDRFTEEIICKDRIRDKYAYIITDAETGRQYLLYRRGNCSGMVELEG